MSNIIPKPDPQKKTLDLICKQGTSWEFMIRLKSVEGTPIDLSRVKVVRGQIRKRPRAKELVANFDCEIINSIAGIIRISLPTSEKQRIVEYLIKKRKKEQVLWKRFQWIEWVFVFVSVTLFLIVLQISLVKVIVVLVLLGGLWTFLYDGILNLLKGRSFFYVSLQTESVIEKKLSKYLRSTKVLSIIIMTLLICLTVIVIAVF